MSGSYAKPKDSQFTAGLNGLNPQVQVCPATLAMVSAPPEADVPPPPHPASSSVVAAAAAASVFVDLIGVILRVDRGRPGSGGAGCRARAATAGTTLELGR